MSKRTSRRNLPWRFIFYSLIVIYSFSVISSFHDDDYASVAFKSKRPEPLVTVIVTTYNVESYVRTSMMSILTQTYKNLQVIVVDDFSSDLTTTVVLDIAAQDKRVKPIFLRSQTLGGVGTPSNLGIRKASGKYVVFVDGDDHASPDFIAKLVRVAEKASAELVVCDFVLFEDSNSSIVSAYDQKYWPDNITVLNSQRKTLNPASDTFLFEFAAVPWRKLYLRTFLLENSIAFPEGDYFFEDNSFHWSVMIAARKVSIIYEQLINHRVGRTGQTTSFLAGSGSLASLSSSMPAFRLAGMFMNQNNVGKEIESCPVVRKVCRTARTKFLTWLKRSTWIISKVKMTGNTKMTAKFSNIRNRNLKLWSSKFAPFEPKEKPLPKKTFVREQPLLSIVVPCRNSAKFILPFVRTVTKLSISFELFFVDDGSTDSSLLMLSEYVEGKDNMFLLSGPGGQAGKARNLAIPLCEGRFIIFIDIDDTFDPDALGLAVASASEHNDDILMIPYHVQYVNSSSLSESLNYLPHMFNPDTLIWKTSNISKNLKYHAMSLINYPWNRICKTKLLHDENVYFGATTVNNDIQFHWHSLLVSTKVRFWTSNRAVIVHRKFVDRTSLTDVKSEERFSLISALMATHRVLSNSGMKASPGCKKAWSSFVVDILRWGRQRVPANQRTAFDALSASILRRAFRDPENNSLPSSSTLLSR